jgi:UTP--glucose-1-phosphate uridylyltransferase
VVPKELLPLGVKPLIHHALEEAERAGFTRAVVVVSPRKRALEAYFEHEPRLERMLEARGEHGALASIQDATAIAERLRLTFVEQPQPMGLGDAVIRCRAVAGETFGVLLPDDVVTSSAHWGHLLELQGQTRAACLCVRPVAAEQINRFGIAICEPVDGRLHVNGLVEKPAIGSVQSTLSIFGRYVVTGAVLDALEELRAGSRGELQLTDGFGAVLARPPGVLAVQFTADFFDNGTPEEYARSMARYSAAATDQWTVRERVHQLSPVSSIGRD